MEETSVRRRLDSLSRHLLPPRQKNSVLHPVLLNGGEGGGGDGGGDPVVIGGMVLDIHATPSIPANPRTTTPGEVHYVLGGVARNVAECMSKLGTKPYMISVVGLDVAGNMLLEHWKSAGLSIEGIQKRQDVGTAVVCNIFDIKGELASAVANVEAIEKFLRPEWIQQFKCSICSAPVLMVDANLNPVALEASCRMAAESDVPVWFEPVSVEKSKRITSAVKIHSQLIYCLRIISMWGMSQSAAIPPYHLIKICQESEVITIVSPNEDELVAMANALSNKDMFKSIEIDDSSSIESIFLLLKPAICVLLDKGIKIVLVTLGSNGIFLCLKGGPSHTRIGLKRTRPNGFGRQLLETITSSCPSNHFFNARESGGTHLYAVHFPALPASVVRLTGAGDCLVGGTLASLCAGLDVFQSVAVGIASAKAAVESQTNVPGECSMSTIAGK